MNGLMVKGFGAAGLAVVLATGAVPAEAMDISCYVPFEFVVNGKELPAGRYQVSIQNSVLIVRGYAVGGAVTVTDALASREETGARLVFHRYGDRHVLREAWGGRYSGRAVPESVQERELKVGAVTGMQRVSIPAS
jgi:hypothetical protein